MSSTSEPAPPFGKIAAGVMGAFLVLWGAALFLGLPFLYGRKVQALVGQPAQVVRRELGPPKAEWPATAFACGADWPCQHRARGGPVWLYADEKQGWYLFFGPDSTLQDLERSERR